jgi:hypothetical protein
MPCAAQPAKSCHRRGVSFPGSSWMPRMSAPPPTNASPRSLTSAASSCGSFGRRRSVPTSTVSSSGVTVQEIGGSGVLTCGRAAEGEAQQRSRGPPPSRTRPKKQTRHAIVDRRVKGGGNGTETLGRGKRLRMQPRMERPLHRSGPLPPPLLWHQIQEECGEPRPLGPAPHNSY